MKRQPKKPDNARQRREEKRREDIKESLRQLRELWGARK